LNNANLTGIDLCHADLCEANLYQANLSEAILHHASFWRANLSQACLKRASLLHADLTGANLRGASLSEANLAYADLSQTDLSDADLSYANLTQCKLTDANLTLANLEGTILAPMGLNHCHKLYPNQKISIWEKMRFRSQVEIQVAQVLEARGLLYCPNSLTRLGSYHRSFEVDFLVCCPTRLGFKWAILEIDGYWHLPQKRAKEQERERLFEHSGIRVYRFDAKLCSKNPDAVVSELLELMSK
jgi:uncharacterized protein YjbI with pentapeptide repeats